MRHAPKLMLLAVSAIATTALAAPSGFAQTEPMLHTKVSRLIVQSEVHETNDVNCPLVAPSPAPNPGPLTTTGGCRLHVSGTNVVTSAHVSAGVEMVGSTCDWEFNVRVDSVGEGYISHQELTGLPADCARRPCGQVVPPTGEGRAWSMFMDEREPGPTEQMELLYCLENRADGTNPRHCEVELPISQPTVHRYRLTAVDVSGHGTTFPDCEIDGTFDVEAVLGNTGENLAEQNVEIRHS
jgi:hypothetical protein